MSPPGPPTAPYILKLVSGGLAGGSALFAVGGLAATPWLFIPAGALLLASGVVAAVRAGLQSAPRRPLPGAPARIGAGADIHQSARIQPGAVIEMGATVKADALIGEGAVVRMGATIGRRAVVEPGAVIGWGAEVHEGARVQRDASVGAGATVRKGAVLEAGAHLGAGSTLRANLANLQPAEHPQPPTAASPARALAPAPDARWAELDALCTRLESELQQAPVSMKEWMATSLRQTGSMRDALRNLHQRERTLRSEVTPEVMGRIDREAQLLAEKLQAATDPQLQTALRQAQDALEAQRAQRQVLARNADRLEAELSRLRYSAEGLVAQLVQVRTGGVVAGPARQLESGLGRLRDEIGAVAEALEAVDAEERAALRDKAR